MILGPDQRPDAIARLRSVSRQARAGAEATGIAANTEREVSTDGDVIVEQEAASPFHLVRNHPFVARAALAPVTRIDIISRAHHDAQVRTTVAIAAIAAEHQAELHSNAIDFGRFPGLRWRNPLTE
jgi:hypothetical protein